MQYVQFYACGGTGVAAPGAAVEVFAAGTVTLAALFDQDGETLANPLTAGNTGLVAFAAADGDYDVVVTLPGGSASEPQRFYLFDPGDPTVGGGGSGGEAPSTASVPLTATVSGPEGSGISTMSDVVSQLIAAEAQVSGLLSSIASANALIAALTTTYGDTASAAASSAAAQGYSQAAATAEANAQTYEGGALTAQVGAGTYASQAQGFAQAASAQFTAVQAQAGTVSTLASTAQGYASAASVSAAAAQSFYNLSATVGSGALNANPTFAAYAGTGSMPTGWTDGGNAVGASYHNVGFDSPNAFCIDCSTTYANEGVDFAQDPGGAGANYGLNFVGSGYYVLELDVYVHSMAAASTAGAYLACYSQNAGQGTPTAQLIVSLSGTPDTNGATGIVGGRRQYAVFGQVTNAGSIGVVVQSNGLYGNLGASNIEWHKVLLRPASSAEIAGQQALTTANANTATISSFQAAQVSQNSAFSTSITTLNAAVFNAAGGSLQSQISTVSATQATQGSTFAQQITTLQAQVSINPNLLPNGGFANGFTDWGFGLAGAHAVVSDAQYGTLAYIQYGSTGDDIVLQSVAINCVAGREYCLSGNIQAVDGNGSYYPCYLDRIYYNSAGQELLDGGQTIENYGLGLTAPDYVYPETAPSTAATMVIRLVVNAPSGVGITAYIQRVKVEVGGYYSGWSDDNSAVALTASVNTTIAAVATLQGQLFATYTLTATAGNVITGLQLLSASGATTISAVVFQAENFLIKSQAASSVFSPFAYNSETGTLSLQNIVVTNAVIGTAAIGTLNIAGGAVNQFYSIVFNVGGTVGPGVGGASQTPGTPAGGSTTVTPGSGTNRGAIQ